VLGTHVPGLTLDDVVGVDAERFVGVGYAEVAQFDLALQADEDVGRRHIAMDDADRTSVVGRSPVCIVQSAQGFGDHQERVLNGQRRLGAGAHAQELVEVEALDVLHGDVQKPVRLTQIVHLHDVGVIEQRGQLRFGDEQLREFAARRQAGQDLFDDHQTAGAEIGLRVGEKDVGHATPPDPIEQGVAPELARERRFGGGRGGGDGSGVSHGGGHSVAHRLGAGGGGMRPLGSAPMTPPTTPLAIAGSAEG
jgi:hypothetical protein